MASADTTGAQDEKMQGPSALVRRSERTPRSRIRRHAERSAPAEAQRILDAGQVAHVAYALDGQPHVLPFL